MLKYFVRTTSERTLDESYSQVEYELLVDKEHKLNYAFIESLEAINDYDAVLLEDDCILCKDFKNRIEDIISKYPNEIINFFTGPSMWFKTRRVLGNFAFNQCTYYPKGIAKQIADEIKKKKNFEKIGYDILECSALLKLNLTHIQYRPCLVQHIDNNTLQSYYHFNPRRSPYFIDYLDELGISYEEAYKYKDKLVELMNNKFKII